MILALAQAVARVADADAGIRQETMQFARRASLAVIRGQLKVDTTVDYRALVDPLAP